MSTSITLTGQLLALVAVFAYLASAVRLLCFRREGYRHRRGISLVAGLLIGTLFCTGLDILLYNPRVSVWQTALAILLCNLVYRNNGNVAALLRPSL